MKIIRQNKKEQETNKHRKIHLSVKIESPMQWQNCLFFLRH
jgi:hypothetical protein